MRMDGVCLTAWTTIRPPVYSATERIKESGRFSRLSLNTPDDSAWQVPFVDDADCHYEALWGNLGSAAFSFQTHARSERMQSPVSGLADERVMDNGIEAVGEPAAADSGRFGVRFR
jgi:hypothetical protein